MKKLFEAMTQQQSLLRKRLRGPPAISVPRVQAPSPEQEDAMSLTASEGMEPQELIFPSEDVKSDVWLPRLVLVKTHRGLVRRGKPAAGVAVPSRDLSTN
ncbi:UNVERIFIED_CONTAM: hypothetical protein FKN15_028127 [Acipenser sinensis]